MNERPKILDILKNSPGEGADRALIEGLLEVEPVLQPDLIQILLDRKMEIGLQGLPALFNKLTPEARDKIVGNARQLFGALRACIRSSSSQTRLNALEIVRLNGNPRLAYLAGQAIHDGSPKIRAEAAATLHHLTNQHARTGAETATALRDAVEQDPRLSRAIGKTLRMLAEERRHLVTPLDEALRHYESHHRPEVLEAAMQMPLHLESALFAHSTIKRGKLTHAILEILSKSLSPRFVPFIYIALCYPELRRRIIPILAACKDAGFISEFIRWSWLARDPSIRKHLVAIRHIAYFKDGFAAAFDLPDDAAALAPSWLLGLGLPNDEKVSLLMSFLLIDNPRANLAALWVLVKIKTQAGTLALEGLVDHDDATIRRIAQREILRRARPCHPPRPKPDLRGRPEAWVNLLARANLSEEFEAFWQNYEHIHPRQAQSAGHHVLEFVPGFATQLQVKLISPQPYDRLRAVRLTTALCLCDLFQKNVFAIANDNAPEIRVAAMSALGRIGDETSRRILERALMDDEPAVQAAAIESLDQMEAERRQELVAPKTASDNAEVRAAAIRTLLKLRLPEGANALIAMLQDSRADHRCAALWIVDQLNLATICDRIVEIANSDPDRRIARIALHVARRLRRARATVKTNKREKVAT